MKLCLLSIKAQQHIKQSNKMYLEAEKCYNYRDPLLYFLQYLNIQENEINKNLGALNILSKLGLKHV